MLQTQVPAERVTSLAFSPSGATLAALCWGGALHVFDAEPHPSPYPHPKPDDPGSSEGLAAAGARQPAAAAAESAPPGPMGFETQGFAQAPAEHAPRVMAIEHGLPLEGDPGFELTLNPMHGPWRPRAVLPGQPVRPEETAASLLAWELLEAQGPCPEEVPEGSLGGAAPAAAVPAPAPAALAARQAASAPAHDTGSCEERFSMSLRGKPVLRCASAGHGGAWQLRPLAGSPDAGAAAGGASEPIAAAAAAAAGPAASDPIPAGAHGRAGRPGAASSCMGTRDERSPGGLSGSAEGPGPSPEGAHDGRESEFGAPGHERALEPDPVWDPLAAQAPGAASLNPKPDSWPYAALPRLPLPEEGVPSSVPPQVPSPAGTTDSAGATPAACPSRNPNPGPGPGAAVRGLALVQWPLAAGGPTVRCVLTYDRAGWLHLTPLSSGI